MISDQRNVDGQREPFPGKQEQQVEQHMKRILRQDQLQEILLLKRKGHRDAANFSTYRIQWIALIYRVFVVRFQLVKCNHMKYREKDQKCVDNQSHNVAESRKVKCHGSASPEASLPSYTSGLSKSVANEHKQAKVNHRRSGQPQANTIIT